MQVVFEGVYDDIFKSLKQKKEIDEEIMNRSDLDLEQLILIWNQFPEENSIGTLIRSTEENYLKEAKKDVEEMMNYLDSFTIPEIPKEVDSVIARYQQEITSKEEAAITKTAEKEDLKTQQEEKQISVPAHPPEPKKKEQQKQNLQEDIQPDPKANSQQICPLQNLSSYNFMHPYAFSGNNKFNKEENCFYFSKGTSIVKYYFKYPGVLYLQYTGNSTLEATISIDLEIFCFTMINNTLMPLLITKESDSLQQKTIRKISKYAFDAKQNVHEISFKKKMPKDIINNSIKENLYLCISTDEDFINPYIYQIGSYQYNSRFIGSDSIKFPDGSITSLQNIPLYTLFSIHQTDSLFICLALQLTHKYQIQDFNRNYRVINEVISFPLQSTNDICIQIHFNVNDNGYNHQFRLTNMRFIG